MIATISGKIAHVEPGSLIIEIGGIGLQVFVPNPISDQARPGESVYLFTHLVVRQDLLALYGFDSAEGASSLPCY